MADRSSSQRVVTQLWWSVAAVAAGVMSGWVDQRSSEVQSTVLVLMSLNFAIALPGRAWWPLTALISVMSMAA